MTTGFQQWRTLFIEQHHGIEPSAADAWNATRPPQDERGQELKWCSGCGEGVTNFCRGKSELCEMFPAEPAPPVALSTLTEIEISELRDRYGITSNGRGIKEFTQVVDFARAILTASAPAQQAWHGWKLVPVEPTTAMVSAMAGSKARDEEGEFPALMDLIDYGGENKTHTVLKAAYQSMLDAAPAHEPATQPQPVAAEELIRDLLWNDHRECCGCPDFGAEYMGQRETVCCGNPEPAMLNDKQIVATLRAKFPEAGTGSDESAKGNGNG